MASLDFEREKTEFRHFYEQNYDVLEDAKDSFVALINALVTHSGNIEVAKVEGRIKEKEECIRKFHRKYRPRLEEMQQPYSIQSHITDLIGLRVVCLYEDEVEKIGQVLGEHFEVIEVSNKIAHIENTEASFGYKGLHLDLRLGESRRHLPEYTAYAGFNFEIQIRTIIQDSWSVLDHKIKYKKAIPNALKRRINTLAALFELADREFSEIRNATEKEIQRAEEEPEEAEDLVETRSGAPVPESELPASMKLNAFSFLKIARHFFNQYGFEPHRVDGFVQEIEAAEPGMTRRQFNHYLREHIAKVKRYQQFFESKNVGEKLSPFTVIRHCLYLGNKTAFAHVLSSVPQNAFEAWLADN